MPTHRATLRIGTSGYIYKHWRDVFYPSDVPQKRWLAYYAEHFGTVELNAPFYRKPTVEAVERWPTAVPKGFRFAVKMWRGITHYRQLINARDLLHKFLPIINHLPRAYRGPLLVQLPQRMKPQPERLATFIDDVRAVLVELDEARTAWELVLEPRNPAWVTPDVISVLDKKRVTLCVADMPYCRIDEPNAKGPIYVRRHGGRGDAGNYTAEQIAADAARIRRWLEAGRNVWVYYNNDWHGHAVHNAQELAAHLAEWADTPAPHAAAS